MKKRITLLAAILFLSSQLFAANVVVRKIQVRGLQRIPLATVYNYLPIRVGQKLTTKKSDEIINALYKTGFFNDIQLSEQGNTLIVTVQERPVIGRIVISGNKLIKSKALLKVLSSQGVADGYEYNKAVLQTLKMALLDQYYSHGKYNARVKVKVIPLKGNRVAVDIVMSEGLTAVIKEIKVIGNHAFDEKTLLSQFQLTTPGWLSWFTHDDQYASGKLAHDLQALQAFYLNRGYLKFKIHSSQVSLSPDRQHVYIAVRITEGKQYHFSGSSLTGKLVLPKEKLRPLITVKKGNVFSKQAIVASENAIGHALGNLGYYRAQVKTAPSVNEKNKTVFIRFVVVPGPLVYVHHISFAGNTHTNDFAFRRALTQLEGSLVSTQRIQESKQNLMMMPFVSHVAETTTRVPGTNNQVNMKYDIVTRPAGEIKAGVGYDDVDGVLINGGLSQQNFFGTGNTFGFHVSYSASLLSAAINYYNPYYTSWGVGRGFNIYASHYDADKANIADYATDNYGAAVNYSIPLARFDSLQIGFGLDALHLELGSTAADEMTSFVHQHGTNFIQIPINLGWVHDSFNRAIFPTIGLFQTAGIVVSAPVEKNSLEYYKVSYRFVYYHPIYHAFLAKFRGNAGFGDGYGSYNELPFFKNFYTGGISSIRGYTANTIGPIDSNGDPLGGNLLVDASAALIFPNPFDRHLRTSIFFDAGNVYNTHATSVQNDRNLDSSGLRYSAGMEFDWLSPLGMLKFSLADALNASKQDQESVFQFTIGTSV